MAERVDDGHRPHRAADGPGRGRLRALGRLVDQICAASVVSAPPVPAPPAARASRTAPVRPRRAGRGPGRNRLPGPMAVIVVLMGLILTGLGYQHVTGVNPLPDALVPDLRPPPRHFPVLPPSRPVGLDIPAMRLRAAVHDTGIGADGTISPPPPDRYDEAGWYDESPTPGQYGPAVLVGHVDTRTGPAVFHGLDRLRPGDRVEVRRSDGSVAVFEVTEVDRFDKRKMPTDQVFGDFSRPGLRLITCGGRWVGGRVGYADNVVVFAELVEARR